MKNFIILFILLLSLSCCKTTKVEVCKIDVESHGDYAVYEDRVTEENKHMLPDSFFAKVAVDDIGTIDTTNVKYRKRDMELSGYAYSPVIGYENIADKKPKYAVFIQDNFTIKKNYSKIDETAIDSIGIYFILIKKYFDTGEKAQIIHMQYKSKLDKFKESDFDFSILADIRKNFLLRMKYTKFYLRNGGRLPMLTEVYLIY